MYVRAPSATEMPPGMSNTKLLSACSTAFSESAYKVRMVSIFLVSQKEMATQVLTKHRHSSFVHGLETAASAVGHGLTIANAVKTALPVMRSLGTAAMAFL